MAVIFIVILAFLLAGLSSAFKKQTGVDLPSGNAGKRIRRRAREVGISEEAALDTWVENKLKIEAAKKNPLPRPKPSKLMVSVRAVEPPPEGSTEYQIFFDMHCKDCGGFVIDRKDEDPRQPVTCKACGLYFCRYPTLEVRLREIGRKELVARGLASDSD